MAREASTLSLATCHAGFARHGIDPVGETSNVPDNAGGNRATEPTTEPARGDIIQPGVSTPGREAAATAPITEPRQGRHPNARRVNAGGREPSDRTHNSAPTGAT